MPDDVLLTDLEDLQTLNWGAGVTAPARAPRTRAA